MDAALQLNSALAGRYTIEREIGRGGMATVFLARDLRHDRRVALKLLNPELGAVLGVERFLAEIKVTANLQHPNLLPLFDSGEANGLLFYVMPFVDGESLRARLEREKQLPIDEALRIAVAIAGALDHAHRHGVIHRDLKPENILLQDGHPLVSDFGIALAVTNAGGNRITQTGLSLGTPQYMSPEQATGDRAIDGRTDIYSLAAVLYEMLVGDPPYLGSTAQAVIAKVLTERPSAVRSSRPSVPPHVDGALQRAFEKLPADRFATALEFSEALQGRGPVTAAQAHGPPSARSARWPVPVLATLLAIATAVAIWAFRRPAPPGGMTTRFVVTLPPDVSVDNLYAPLTISHDGRTVIFRGATSSGVQLMRRDIDRLETRPIPGTTDAGWPTVSPDDKWIAFVAGGQIRKVPFDGGPSVPIGAVTGTNGAGIAWAPNDTLVIGGWVGHLGLSVIPAAGGAARPLTRPDTAKSEQRHMWPRVLADGQTIVFESAPTQGLHAARLAVGSLGSSDYRLLDLPGAFPLGVAADHLLYVNADGVLMAVPFDAKARAPRGTPIALLEGVNINTAVGAARIALSNSGTLVYLAGGAMTQLVSVDMAGVAQPLLPQPNAFVAPSWSPDGKRIALQVLAGARSDIWLFDLSSSALTRLTSDGTNSAPSWAPDGKHIIFRTTRSTPFGIWWQLADGSAPAEKLFDPPEPVINAVMARDGHTLVYRSSGPASNEIWSVDLQGDKKPRPVVATAFSDNFPAISPNGEWIAYTTDESGSSQVYVKPFPGPGGVTQVSVDGGAEPVWAPDGKHLYYRRGRQVISAAITAGATLTVGERRTLFEGPYLSAGVLLAQAMSVSPDGKRLVMLRRLTDDSQLIVVTNWLTELRARTSSQRR